METKPDRSPDDMKSPSGVKTYDAQTRNPKTIVWGVIITILALLVLYFLYRIL